MGLSDLVHVQPVRVGLHGPGQGLGKTNDRGRGAGGGGLGQNQVSCHLVGLELPYPNRIRA